MKDYLTPSQKHNAISTLWRNCGQARGEFKGRVRVPSRDPWVFEVASVYEFVICGSCDAYTFKELLELEARRAPTTRAIVEIGEREAVICFDRLTAIYGSQPFVPRLSQSYELSRSVSRHGMFHLRAMRHDLFSDLLLELTLPKGST